MLRLVVGRDSNVDEFQAGVGIAKRNNGNVDVGRFADGLVVNARVGDNDQPRFFERAGDVVGEVTRGETTSNGLSASVGCEFEDGTVTVWASRDDADCTTPSAYILSLCIC